LVILGGPCLEALVNKELGRAKGIVFRLEVDEMNEKNAGRK
jgi:hypothetical protein